MAKFFFTKTIFYHSLHPLLKKNLASLYKLCIFASAYCIELHYKNRVENLKHKIIT